MRKCIWLIVVVLLGFAAASMAVINYDHRETAKKKAEIKLGYLRAGTEFYESFEQELRAQLKKANLSLASIRTSEKELAELRVKGCKAAAGIQLYYLRGGTEFYEDFDKELRAQLKKGNLALASIGTSDKELAKLQKK